MQQTAYRTPLDFPQYLALPKPNEAARLHRAIYGRIVQQLAGRPQSWLCRESGVPETTLSYQLRNQKFTVEVLVSVADTLGVEVGWLLTGQGEKHGIAENACQAALARIAAVIDETRQRKRR